MIRLGRRSAPAKPPEPPPQRSLPPGKQWRAHVGNRARRRYQRQLCRAAFQLKDEASVAAMERVRAAVADDPDPEAALMNLVAAALAAADGTGATWAQAMNHLLDKFEERAGATEAR